MTARPVEQLNFGKREFKIYGQVFVGDDSLPMESLAANYAGQIFEFIYQNRLVYRVWTGHEWLEIQSG